MPKQAQLRRLNRTLLELAKSDLVGQAELGTALRQITSAAAEALGCERVGVWIFADDRSGLECADLFERSPGRHTRGLQLTAADYPNYFRALEEDRIIPAHDAHTDPRTREFSASYLTPLGIKSMLDAPIRIEGRMCGVVCHEHVGIERRWSHDEESFAASIGDLVALAIEASKRRAAELALTRSEKRFRSLIENALDGIAIVDRRGEFLYVSPSTERILGYTPAELVGGGPFALVHPDDAARLREVQAATVRRPGVVASVEVRFRHRDGRWRTIETVGQNRLEDPDVAGVVINFRDVTERRAAEELAREYSRSLEAKVDERTHELKDRNTELERTLEQLRDAQEQLLIREKLVSLGALVAGVAHEVNNPVAAVISANDTSDRCLNKISTLVAPDGGGATVAGGDYIHELIDVMRDNNRVIVVAAERIARIVRNLKAFARLDEAELQYCDLHEGLETTLAVIEHELRERATVVREYGTIPRIRCYPSLLNQVFLNLLLNAVQALDRRGTIRIRTFAEPEVVSVAIADTGRGIPPEHIHRIFDPGFTTKGVGVGTGLGLSISYRIVQKHNGEIRVASTVGQGSEFTVALPLDSGDDAE